MKPQWFERARKKWTRDMTMARKRLDNGIGAEPRIEAYFEIVRLRAQALALVLIERASR